MSEYIDIQPETTDDPDVMVLITNLELTQEREHYATHAEGDEGSALAQALFAVPGLASATLHGSELTVRREPDVEWHALIEDLTDALRDFFL